MVAADCELTIRIVSDISTGTSKLRPQLRPVLKGRQRGGAYLVPNPIVHCRRGIAKNSVRMEKQQDHPKPTSPPCLKCSEQPQFTTSMQDQPTGRTFHMFECKCGNRTWISEKT
jgi:hypothetical protein